MAQSQHQYPPPPRAYSPPQTATSPQVGPYLPPAKRQRLSPNPPSPYSSPSLAHTALPSQIFSGPGLYPGTQSNGNQQQQSQQSAPTNEQRNPSPSTGAMGPPSRPVDKPTDMNELSDVLAGSGVDLKEEEAALVGRSNFSNQQQNSYHTNSFLPNGSAPGSYSVPDNRSYFSQNVPGDRSSFYGAGTFNQAPGPYQSIEERAEEEKKRAIRRKAERKQYHLNAPFLQTGIVQRRLEKTANAMHVIVPRTGVLSSQHQGGPPVQVAIMGPDKNEVLTALRGEPLIYEQAPVGEMIALMSLAAQERLRAVVEDSASLAKGRRIGTQGVVPPDWADLAVGLGEAESIDALPTPGTSAVSPHSNPLKRSFSEVNNPLTPISNDGKPSAKTIAFSSPTADALRGLSQDERSFEEARVAKRTRRAANSAISGEASRAGSIPVGASVPSTPGGSVPGDRAPEPEIKKSISKKELKRQAESKNSEAQQHAATNQAANMALGGGKRPSWMMKAGPATKAGFGSQSRAASSSQAQSQGMPGPTAGSSVGQAAQGKRGFGDFREDKEGGAGIQIRDVVSILEPEPKEKKTLARAYNKMASRG